MRRPCRFAPWQDWLPRREHPLAMQVSGCFGSGIRSLTLQPWCLFLQIELGSLLACFFLFFGGTSLQISSLHFLWLKPKRSSSDGFWGSKAGRLFVLEMGGKGENERKLVQCWNSYQFGNIMYCCGWYQQGYNNGTCEACTWIICMSTVMMICDVMMWKLDPWQTCRLFRACGDNPAESSCFGLSYSGWHVQGVLSGWRLVDMYTWGNGSWKTKWPSWNLGHTNGREDESRWRTVCGHHDKQGAWERKTHREQSDDSQYYELSRRLLLICALLTLQSFDGFRDMVSISIKYTQCIPWSRYCLLLQDHPSMDPERWWKNNVVINRRSIY